MNEEIKQLNEDSRIQDKLREAMIKQMEIGYQEMAEINLSITNEWYNVENEAEAINENVWK
ncbi:hypothetical protein ABD91_00525 [Lysinibacillus sphaericus]|uniref:hypothetical protein n=1 Tax=Lysinibacillus sphaericus TaxID=1421 RepID=UPI0018CD3A36|nr:hypothetical protein [Lysinibacillus sphaericus]MBG9689412.1 hypothetical protein [Lysinibacillus sphaericus]